MFHRIEARTLLNFSFLCCVGYNCCQRTPHHQHGGQYDVDRRCQPLLVPAHRPDSQGHADDVGDDQGSGEDGCSDWDLLHRVDQLENISLGN